MPIRIVPDAIPGSDQFNRLQMQDLGEGRCHSTWPVPRADSGQLRVLVVDDQRDTTDMLALLISRWGHVAQRAYDGVSALSAAARQRPDVVLLDIYLPRLDGFQVVERMRGDPLLRGCFLIVMSGQSEPACRTRCHKLGVDLFLIKPVVPSLLETMLNLECARLGRSRQARAAQADGLNTIN
jgi:CheY-like chemotaxis protein